MFGAPKFNVKYWRTIINEEKLDMKSLSIKHVNYEMEAPL